MILFRIDKTDLTNKIVAPTYKINSKPVYKKWIDANAVTHREIYRKKVEGTFTIKFKNKEEYFHFLELLKEYTTNGGYVPVSLYVNNLNEVRDANVFIDIDPENKIPYIGTGQDNGFKVKIEEC